MTARTRWLFVGVVLAASLVMIGASLFVGTETLDVGQAWRDWRADVPVAQSPTLSVLLRQRLPRTLAALITGAGLALIGACFQALLRNPLATPYTLGIASAGSFGAWTATIVEQTVLAWPVAELTGASRAFRAAVSGFDVAGFTFVQAAAFLFAAFDVAIIYLLATKRARISPAVLLLTGVTLGMLANSGILLMRYLARPDRLVVMDRWLMGGVDVIGFGSVITLAVWVTPAALLLLLQRAKYDQLGFNIEIAEGRGVNVRRLQTVTLLVGSFMTAIIVSVVGPIGFVGLIVPHTVRAITGSRHRVLLPVSLAAGGGFLCLCDILARKLLTGETPIGIVTSLIGGPFFLYLLTRKRALDWGG